MPVDAVMFATGRVPNTRGLGLEAAGVALGPDGAVVVDERSRSQRAVDLRRGRRHQPHQPHAGRDPRRPGRGDVALRRRRLRADHADVPSAVFSQPPIGTVGLTERQAVERLGAVDVYKATFRPLKATLSGRTERTLMKLLVDHATQRVVGAHMVGPDAPEIIQGIAIAVKAGLTKAQFDATVGIHPTAAEEFVTLKNHQTVRGPVA